MRIPSESWSKIQTTIRQYPKNCRLITEWEMEVLDANLKEKDPTGHKAMLLSSEYAQRLMREHPEMLLADVAEESGFSNEQSFFRTFKARTGLTPQEWKAQQ